MKRYHIPRLAFINKLDRQGANPDRVIGQLRDKLKLNASAVQIPIGLEDAHKGVVDLVRDRAVVFKGPNGDEMEIGGIPTELKEKAAAGWSWLSSTANSLWSVAKETASSLAAELGEEGAMKPASQSMHQSMNQSMNQSTQREEEKPAMEKVRTPVEERNEEEDWMEAELKKAR